MDDIQEQTEIANEISNALSQPVGFQDVDEVVIFCNCFVITKFVVMSCRMSCCKNSKNWNRKTWRRSYSRLVHHRRSCQDWINYQMSVSVTVAFLPDIKTLIFGFQSVILDNI